MTLTSMLRILIVIFSVTVLTLQCKPLTSSENTFEDSKIEPEIVPPSTALPETLYVDIGLPYLNDLKRGRQWLTLPPGQLIDSLQSRADTSSVYDFKEAEYIYPTYPDLSSYTSFNIPLPVYEKITDAQVMVEKMHIPKGTSCEQKESYTLCNYGMKYYYERPHYGMYQLVNHQEGIILFLRKQGKYSPDMSVALLDTTTLKVKGERLIFGGIHDAGDVNVTVSELSGQYDTLTIFRYKNDGNWGEIDSTCTRYVMTSSGYIPVK